MSVVGPAPSTEEWNQIGKSFPDRTITAIRQKAGYIHSCHERAEKAGAVTIAEAAGMHHRGVGPPRGRKVSKVSKKRKLTVAKKDTRAHSSQRLPCKAPRKVMASKAPRKVLATAADLTD